MPAYRKTESKHHLPTRKGKYAWNVKYITHSNIIKGGEYLNIKGGAVRENNRTIKDQ